MVRLLRHHRFIADFNGFLLIGKELTIDVRVTCMMERYSDSSRWKRYLQAIIVFKSSCDNQPLIIKTNNGCQNLVFVVWHNKSLVLVSVYGWLLLLMLMRQQLDGRDILAEVNFMLYATRICYHQHKNFFSSLWYNCNITYSIFPPFVQVALKHT